MTLGDDASRSIKGVDFFISYSPADEQWATWIAWELEKADYTTMLQAWDFVPGTNFIDFMDRGVSTSIAVIAVLSRNYMRSTYGRLEWQAAIRRSPHDPGSRLITVRIEDFPLEGLLATITFVDLVPVGDRDTARQLLLGRIRAAMNGRAKPAADPGFPRLPGAAAGFLPHIPDHAARLAHHRRPVQVRPPGRAVRLLHLAGPRLDRRQAPPQLQAKRVATEVVGALDRLPPDRRVAPDMLLIAGDITGTGSLREFEAALEMLSDLRGTLGLEADRVAVVPGSHDINEAACRAYFANCEADEVEPEIPYWPKWRHYLSFLRQLYADGIPLPFLEGRPWGLMTVPELRLAVAAVNSTMMVSHTDHGEHGTIGEEQARWFADALAAETDEGWLRVGLVHHEITDAGLLSSPLDLLATGHTSGTAGPGRLITLIRGDSGTTVETDDL
ncbi:TIR domain-containing protein [Actinoplanes rectilineatus]|uniref:TIR domain-containing protein n=1 Tax=Actinoplanes rectilineatus TaxID=113571 RepID=UPI0005F297D7|nr:TIR domain-containing protein [Actinoplanes rectilineatus]